MTVSRAFKKDASISSEKREKILSIARQYGYIPNKAAIRLTQCTICIGVIIMDAISDFTSKIIAGLNVAYKELMDYKVEMDLRVVKPGTTTSQYIRMFEEFIKNGCQGILFSIDDYSDEFIAKLNEYAEMNIFMASIVEQYNGIKNLCNVFFNPELKGKMACELLSSCINGKHIAVFTGPQKTYIYKSLLSCFFTEAKKRGLFVDCVYDTKNDPLLAAEQIRTALTDFPDINGIYISSANSVPILDTLIDMKKTKDIRVIASDVFPRMKEYLNNGDVTATIFQNQYKQAKEAMIYLYNCIAGNEPLKEQIFIEPIIVINSNIDLYL